MLLETRKLQQNARNQISRVCEEHDRFNLLLEEQRSKLERKKNELQEREARLENDLEAARVAHLARL